MTDTKTPRQELGGFGERVAAARGEGLGMTILARNVRLKASEVDILARDGEDLVFIEVRTRRAMPGAAGESLDARKRNKMWAAAMEYCERESLDPSRARLDAILVELDARGVVRSVQHLRGLELD